MVTPVVTGGTSDTIVKATNIYDTKTMSNNKVENDLDFYSVGYTTSPLITGVDYEIQLNNLPVSAANIAEVSVVETGVMSSVDDFNNYYSLKEAGGMSEVKSNNEKINASLLNGNGSSSASLLSKSGWTKATASEMRNHAATSNEISIKSINVTCNETCKASISFNTNNLSNITPLNTTTYGGANISVIFLPVKFKIKLVKGEKSPTNWSNAKSGTLLYAMKNSNTVLGTPSKSPGKEAYITTTETSGIERESGLFSTKDDYGVSFYYRGEIENNYVSFANMCWRIVRVTGNGAIKLVLYNSNGSCSASNPSAFAGSSTFNNSGYAHASIGLMYGEYSNSSYGVEHANINKSSILNSLESWYSSKLNSYGDYLADTIWCNDKSVSSNYSSTDEIASHEIGNSSTGYGDNESVFSATNRFFPYETANPTLICPNDNNDGKLSKFTANDVTYGNGSLDYKIGLLTADEVVYAGFTVTNTVSGKDKDILAFYGNNGISNYLFEGTFNTWYTSTPASHHESNSIMFAVTVNTSSGYVSQFALTTSYVYKSAKVRPAVSLVPSTKVTGTGSKNDPFVVTGY